MPEPRRSPTLQVDTHIPATFSIDTGTPRKTPRRGKDGIWEINI